MKPHLLHLFILIITLILLQACGTSSPKRIHTVTSTPVAPMIAIPFEHEEPEEQTLPNSGDPQRPEPGKKPPRDRDRVRFAAGHAQGKAVNDSGEIGRSITPYLSLSGGVTDVTRLGGFLFFGSSELVEDDPYHFGVGAYLHQKIAKTGFVEWSALGSVNYNSNSNDATNCDGNWLNTQPKDKDGKCIITWHSRSEATVWDFQFNWIASLMASKKQSYSIAPGFIFEKFNGSSYVDTQPPALSKEGTKFHPQVMLIATFYGPRQTTYQLTGGWTRQSGYTGVQEVKDLWTLDLKFVY